MAADESHKIINLDSERARESRSESQHPAPARTLAGQAAGFDQQLEQYWGGRHAGFTQGTLPRLDQSTSGIRGLTLLAGAPSVGKTALALQIATDVLRNHEDVCVAICTLEMSAAEIYGRIMCRMARVDWRTLTLGSEQYRNPEHDSGYTQEELDRLREARAVIDDLGRRMMVLDERICPEPTVERVFREVEQLKQETGSTHAVLIVDYLQVWPLPADKAGLFQSDVEADKWRIGQMKTLRDALDGDPLILLSDTSPFGDIRPETVKTLPAHPDRALHTPDTVMLLRSLTDEEMLEALAIDAVRLKLWREDTRGLGKSFTRLEVLKGRDGVTRASLPMTFHYEQCRFEEGILDADASRDMKNAEW